jgi:cell division protease FtsH
VLPRPDEEVSPFGGNPASEATRELIDSEVRRIVDECYEVAHSRLEANRERLESLAGALLERETLDEADAYKAAGFEPRVSDRRPAEPQTALTRETTEDRGQS